MAKDTKSDLNDEPNVGSETETEQVRGVTDEGDDFDDAEDRDEEDEEEEGSSTF